MHIERRRINDLRKYGYQSAEAFVRDVLATYDAVFRGKSARPDVILAKRHAPVRMLILQLQIRDRAWEVKSGRFMDGRRLAASHQLLWELPREKLDRP